MSHRSPAAHGTAPSGRHGGDAARAPGELELTALPVGLVATVAGLAAPLAAAPDLCVRLEEIGFLPGESVRVIARAAFGGPLAVRIGTATFALRRDEARAVRVKPDA